MFLFYQPHYAATDDADAKLATFCTAPAIRSPLSNLFCEVVGTLVLVLATGWLYAVVAVVAGVWFLTMAHQLYAGVRAGDPVKPLRLFLQSNNYLAAVFCALAVDSAIALPTLF